ncbi:hypothetical protein HMPREF9412_5960 [Paenibacillus sp. HGF5]|nr:hypothetical protein HMPREF9412_5960 [Paenibacillus sp. HGF5]
MEHRLCIHLIHDERLVLGLLCTAGRRINRKRYAFRYGEHNPYATAFGSFPSLLIAYSGHAQAFFVREEEK